MGCCCKKGSGPKTLPVTNGFKFSSELFKYELKGEFAKECGEFQKQLEKCYVPCCINCLFCPVECCCIKFGIKKMRSGFISEMKGYDESKTNKLY